MCAFFFTKGILISKNTAEYKWFLRSDFSFSENAFGN